MTAPDALIAAGKTLATTADPHRDLHDIASDIGELVLTLQCIERGLRQAQDRADDIRDGRLDNLAAGKLWNLRERREWTRDEVELSHRNEIATARSTAARTAQRALVSLSQVVGELEMAGSGRERG